MLLAAMSERVGVLDHEAAGWTGRTVGGFIQDASNKYDGASTRSGGRLQAARCPANGTFWIKGRLRPRARIMARPRRRRPR
jgi:hypothetical protein